MKFSFDYLVIGLLMVLMVGWTWWVVDHFSSRERAVQEEYQEDAASQSSIESAGVDSTTAKTTVPESPTNASLLDSDENEGFPAPTVQVVNGRSERTIHMGVRQYAWDPSVITVKKGELVRLIVHNADVQHGLVIPELNVLNIDIPPEGAVIEFEASKVGTFVFFCSYYCGEDHSMMRGKIVVEESD